MKKQVHIFFQIAIIVIIILNVAVDQSEACMDSVDYSDCCFASECQGGGAIPPDANAYEINHFSKEAEFQVGNRPNPVETISKPETLKNEETKATPLIEKIRDLLQRFLNLSD